MNSRRRKKVDTPLSVDLLEDRCLPSAVSIVPLVTDLAQKTTQSLAVLVADVQPDSHSAGVSGEHRQDTGRGHHEKALVSVDIGGEHGSNDNIPVVVTTHPTPVVGSETARGAIDGNHGNVAATVADSVEGPATPVAAAAKATAVTSTTGAPSATVATGANGKAAAAVPESNLHELLTVAAVEMVPSAPANIPRPELPAAPSGLLTPPVAVAADSPAVGNPAPGAMITLATNSIAEEDPPLTEVSTAPAHDNSFSPFAGDLIADLPIHMPDFAAVERAFDQLADWVGLDTARGGGNWLLAAAMAAAAAEVARRQLMPAPVRGLTSADGPPPGWLPEGDDPMPGDDGHA
jgi:hypothetical protein